MRGPFGIEGLRLFWLDCVSMAFDLLYWIDKKKKKIVCLVFFNIFRIIKGHLGSRDLLFLLKLSESIVRSFSMDMGNTLGMRFGLLRTRSWDHYLHQHSHLIVTCFNLEFLGRVVRRCHTLPHLYPSLFLHFFCFIHSSFFLSLLVFFYSY